MRYQKETPRSGLISGKQPVANFEWLPAIMANQHDMVPHIPLGQLLGQRQFSEVGGDLHRIHLFLPLLGKSHF